MKTEITVKVSITYEMLETYIRRSLELNVPKNEINKKGFYKWIQEYTNGIFLDGLEGSYVGYEEHDEIVEEIKCKLLS